MECSSSFLSSARGCVPWRVCGLTVFACAALMLASGCVTRKVWNWAGEGRHTFLPSRVVSLGLDAAEGRPDRLFVRVDSERLKPAAQPVPPDESETYVLEVPSGWRELPRVVLPDEPGPGAVELAELLETKLTPALSDARIASLAPIPLSVEGTLPALDAAPYILVEGPPGVLSLFGSDPGSGTWVRLSGLITGRLVTTPAPKFNYAIAVAATPITGAVDAVGVVIYAVLWPVWASLDISYEDSVDEGFHPDGRYQTGRARGELEKPRSRNDPSDAPVAAPESDSDE